MISQVEKYLLITSITIIANSPNQRRDSYNPRCSMKIIKELGMNFLRRKSKPIDSMELSTAPKLQQDPHPPPKTHTYQQGTQVTSKTSQAAGPSGVLKDIFKSKPSLLCKSFCRASSTQHAVNFQTNK